MVQDRHTGLLETIKASTVLVVALCVVEQHMHVFEQHVSYFWVCTFADAVFKRLTLL